MLAGVSIHFPDGNKNSDVQKSNQVSVNNRGQYLSGLEEARRNIRDLTLLTFYFKIPRTFGIDFQSKTNKLDKLTDQVQYLYNVQVFKQCWLI